MPPTRLYTTVSCLLVTFPAQVQAVSPDASQILPSLLVQLSKGQDHDLILLLEPPQATATDCKMWLDSTEYHLMEAQGRPLEALAPDELVSAYGASQASCDQVAEMPLRLRNAKRPKTLVYLSCPSTTPNQTLVPALAAVNKTVRNCPPLEVQPGLLARDNLFVQLIPEDYHLGPDFENVLFKDDNVRLLEGAVAVRQTPTGIILSRFNFVKRVVDKVRHRTESASTLTTETLLPSRDLRGIRLTALGADYVAFFLTDGKHSSGAYVDWIRAICSGVGAVCQFELIDWSTDFKEVIPERTNSMTTFPPLGWLDNRVLDQTTPFFYDGHRFVSQRPKAYFSVFMMVQPLEASVWLLVAVTALLVAFCLVTVARSEGAVKGQTQSRMASVGTACWYTFGTMLGETVLATSGKASKELNALRFVLLGWLLFVLVVSSGYSGNMRAFMTIPSEEPALDTLDDVVHSGILYDIVPTGIEQELLLSENPTVAKFLEGKTNVVVGESGPELTLLERLVETVHGKRVATMYDSDLGTSISLSGDSRSGELLVHISPQIQEFGTYQGVVSFPKMTPWSRQFKSAVDHLIEADVFDTMLYRNRLAEKNKSGSRNGTSPIRGTLDDGSAMAGRGLSLGNLVGSVLPVASLLTAAVFAFVVEVCKGKERRRRREKATILTLRVLKHGRPVA